MTEYTYASLHSILGLTTGDMPATDTENLMDVALGTINLVGGLDFAAMNGTAGSKTLNLDVTGWALVAAVCRMVYADFYVNQGQNVQGPAFSVTAKDFTSNPVAMSEIRRLCDAYKRSESNPYENLVLL